MWAPAAGRETAVGTHGGGRGRWCTAAASKMASATWWCRAWTWRTTPSPPPPQSGASLARRPPARQAPDPGLCRQRRCCQLTGSRWHNLLSGSRFNHVHIYSVWLISYYMICGHRALKYPVQIAQKRNGPWLRALCTLTKCSSINVVIMGSSHFSSQGLVMCEECSMWIVRMEGLHLLQARSIVCNTTPPEPRHPHLFSISVYHAFICFKITRSQNA